MARSAHLFLLAAVLFVAAVPPLAAQAPDPPADRPETAGAGPQQPEPGSGGDRLVRLVFPDRPSLRVGSVLRLDFRLRLQGDVRDFPPGEADEDGRFEMTRRRFGIQGTLLRHFEYELEREFRRRNAWRDNFVNFSYFDDFQIQAGKFKVPFSLERLTGSTDLDFVHRANVVDTLSPARDIGMTLHGRFRRRAIGYDVGVFRNDGENARFDFNPGAGRTFAARFAARPLRLTSLSGATSEMEVAIAATTAEVPDGLNSLRGRTMFGQTFFNPVYVSGQRVRLGLDLDWRPGPFSVKGEFIRVSDERRNQGLFDEDLPPVIARGWYLSGTWALTGESKFSGGLEPRRPLFRGGAGAIELAARYERLGFGSSFDEEPELTTPRAANLLEAVDRAWTLGLNWYVNHWTKLQLNAIREAIHEGRSPDPRGVFWTRVLRLQFVM
ncbi:MAG: hypothetical protein HYY76_05225 [Acidobacteria bacterium]|nr:hypothetical protein [Acidobacteriota bacterium]